MSAKDYVEKDYYAALGVAKDADQASIKRRTASSRATCTRTRTRATPRPRRGSRRSPRPTTCSRTRTKRKEYDEARSLFGSSAAASGPARRLRRRRLRGGTTFDMSDLFGTRSGGGLGDLFSDLFGGSTTDNGRRRRERGRPGQGPGRVGRDHPRLRRGRARHDAAAAAVGPRHLPDLPRQRRASGHVARTPARTAAAAAWSCVNQGGFGFSEPCRDCRGTGQIIDDPCPECRGSGSTVQTRTITVRVPAGVQGRRQAAHRRQGHAGRARRAGRRPVRHRARRPHPLFGRTGNDLTLTVPITLRRGDARHHAARADARRLGVAEGRAGHAVRTHAARARPRASPPSRRPATCSSPSRSRCRPS